MAQQLRSEVTVSLLAPTDEYKLTSTLYVPSVTGTRNRASRPTRTPRTCDDPGFCGTGPDCGAGRLSVLRRVPEAERPERVRPGRPVRPLRQRAGRGDGHRPGIRPRVSGELPRRLRCAGRFGGEIRAHPAGRDEHHRRLAGPSAHHPVQERLAHDGRADRRREARRRDGEPAPRRGGARNALTVAECLLVTTTVDNREIAEQLAAALVDRRLAA